ncbi:MAG: TRAP transporter small permease [Burkholderiaceae bacterium]
MNRKTPIQILEFISAFVLFALMGITTVDVIGRYFFNIPLLGGLEMTEMALALLIYSALPLVTARREHIVIDTLDSFLSPAVKQFLNKLADTVCAFVFLGIGYLIFNRATRIANYGDTTHVLHIPLAPVAYVMAFMIVSTALIQFVLIFMPRAETFDIGPTTT